MKVRFKAQINDKQVNSDGSAVITLQTDKRILDLIEDRDYYTVEIKEYRNDRSLRQNRLMWALLEIMARAQGQSSWDCYLDVLERFGARYEYLMVLPQAVPLVKQQFRAVREVEYREYNGVTMTILKCFYGSSTFDTKEFSTLVDGILDLLAEMDIHPDDGPELQSLILEVEHEYRMFDRKADQ
jgi:PAS domain-containing protein